MPEAPNRAHQVMRRRRAILLPPTLALTFFALLAFLIACLILFRTGSQVAGYDYFSFHWNFWWTRRALSTPGLELFRTDFVFFPSENNLAFHTLALAWYPLWAVLEPLIGTLAAMSIIILVAVTLNGWAVYAFLRTEGAHRALALVGGAAFQLLPILRYFTYQTHLNLLGWFWLPLHLMLWRRIAALVQARRDGRVFALALVQGVALWLLLLTDQQLPLFLALVLGPLALVSLWASSRRAALVAAGLLAVAVGLALGWIAGPLPYLVGEVGGFAGGDVEARPGIPFPDGFLSMDGEWWRWDRPSLGAFVPLAVLISALASPWIRPRPARWRWFWFAVMLPPLVLALGPTLRLGGLAIPLPYRAVYALSGGLFAMPWRLGPLAALAGLAFVALTWTPLVSSLPARRLAPVMAVLMLALAASLRLGEPGPLSPAPAEYAFYTDMGAETCPGCDEYVVLEVPTAVGTGEVLLGPPDAIALQFHALRHHKRLVNGFLARAPVANYWWVYLDDPMMAWLGQRRPLEPETVAAQLRERVSGWPIGYVVVHRDLIEADGPTQQEIFAFLNAQDDLLCPHTSEGSAAVYRTRWHPLGCALRMPPEIAPGVYELNIGAPGDFGHIGAGWHRPERIFDAAIRWAGHASEATLWVDLPPGEYRLSLTAQAFHEARRLRVRVNETLLDGEVEVSADGLTEATYTIPAGALGDGRRVNVALIYDGSIVPAHVEHSADPRALAIMVDRVRFARIE
ncbi:MAG: hypothetical protein IT323_08575 [Anaerolineae bacterium]|nr:hypothetical protein [Anaerolineae bacterium]